MRAVSRSRTASSSVFYNPAGYISGATAVVDPTLKSEELNAHSGAAGVNRADFRRAVFMIA